MEESLPYGTLKNFVTPGSSLADIAKTNNDGSETMPITKRQLWVNFKRPHAITKFVAVCLMSVVLACYMEVYPWIFQLGNHKQMILTHTTCGAMIAITGATWLGLLIGRDTPHYLTLVHAVIGAVLLLAVSGVCFAVYGRREQASVSMLAIPGYKKIENESLNAGTLFATAFMAMLSSFAYVADIAVVVGTARGLI